MDSLLIGYAECVTLKEFYFERRGYTFERYWQEALENLELVRTTAAIPELGVTPKSYSWDLLLGAIHGIYS